MTPASISSPPSRSTTHAAGYQGRKATVIRCPIRPGMKPRIRITAPSRTVLRTPPAVDRPAAPSIDRGSPPPTPRASWPFYTMEIGDSFLAEGHISSTFSSRVAHATHRTGFRFTMRRVDGGVRVWRTA